MTILLDLCIWWSKQTKIGQTCRSMRQTYSFASTKLTPSGGTIFFSMIINFCSTSSFLSRSALSVIFVEPWPRSLMWKAWLAVFSVSAISSQSVKCVPSSAVLDATSSWLELLLGWFTLTPITWQSLSANGSVTDVSHHLMSRPSSALKNFNRLILDRDAPANEIYYQLGYRKIFVSRRLQII